MINNNFFIWFGSFDDWLFTLSAVLYWDIVSSQQERDVNQFSPSSIVDSLVNDVVIINRDDIHNFLKQKTQQFLFLGETSAI